MHPRTRVSVRKRQARKRKEQTYFPPLALALLVVYPGEDVRRDHLVAGRLSLGELMLQGRHRVLGDGQEGEV